MYVHFVRSTAILACGFIPFHLILRPILREMWLDYLFTDDGPLHSSLFPSSAQTSPCDISGTSTSSGSDPSNDGYTSAKQQQQLV